MSSNEGITPTHSSQLRARSSLLIATTNPNKVREILAVLDGLPVSLKTLSDCPPIDVPDETGATFEENARQKAFYYARATGLTTMAEDSGFEVEALGGAPGILSARYLRDDATYAERFAAIYAAAGRASAARFVCALAVVSSNQILFETTGVVSGQLASRPAGDRGFGYDPIFSYPLYGKTFGEVSPEEKLAVSHRGQAMRALRKFLTILCEDFPQSPTPAP
jgi:XTP/dITP diphosphohydrolase